jgi:putative transposase
MIAFIDVYSRKVLNWSISNKMNVIPITIGRCAQVYQETIEQYGCPEILNTDQGSQFTSPIFTKISVENKIKIFTDGKEEL